ncbi:hypothetical protein Y032_0002g590 [Ancylostoma ceylanicum]|uniref:Uncharacterized protein n=1 Tax=Ancylostoma ceylanicum TaxID=53326 RepID=A0A016W0J8_9BILA|nr:hypothetical protein Y032_0002g590 [Ancylostoma ceylanicum]
MNDAQENPDSPLRRRFSREWRGRAACFSKPRKGHRHRRSLHVCGESPTKKSITIQMAAGHLEHNFLVTYLL